MLSWRRTTIERNCARAFVENARAWYTTCREITRIMADALHDQSIAADDIGYVIDPVDRTLFRLGFYFTDSMGTLMRHNPELAMRFDQISQQVYVVRNQINFLLPGFR